MIGKEGISKVTCGCVIFIIKKINFKITHDKYKFIFIFNHLPIHAILGVKDNARIRIGHMIKGRDCKPMAEETIV